MFELKVLIWNVVAVPFLWATGAIILYLT